MSMLCNLVAVAPDELDRLIREPSGVIDVFFTNDDGEEPRREQHLDLEKRWHGLHYLLTGRAWDGDPPVSLAILGGTEIGGDTGYGPPRYLTPTEVGEVAAALDVLPREVLTQHYDADAMNRVEIYPFGWDAAGVNWLLPSFDELAEFYHTAAAKGRAVLICLS